MTSWLVSLSCLCFMLLEVTTSQEDVRDKVSSTPKSKNNLLVIRMGFLLKIICYLLNIVEDYQLLHVFLKKREKHCFNNKRKISIFLC